MISPSNSKPETISKSTLPDNFSADMILYCVNLNCYGSRWMDCCSCSVIVTLCWNEREADTIDDLITVNMTNVSHKTWSRILAWHQDSRLSPGQVLTTFSIISTIKFTILLFHGWNCSLIQFVTIRPPLGPSLVLDY